MQCIEWDAFSKILLVFCFHINIFFLLRIILVIILNETIAKILKTTTQIKNLLSKDLLENFKKCDYLFLLFG